eukprot:ANDGO_08518.mRNA.1 Pre-mRNA-splicing factor cwc15
MTSRVLHSLRSHSGIVSKKGQRNDTMKVRDVPQVGFRSDRDCSTAGPAPQSVAEPRADPDDVLQPLQKRLKLSDARSPVAEVDQEVNREERDAVSEENSEEHLVRAEPLKAGSQTDTEKLKRRVVADEEQKQAEIAVAETSRSQLRGFLDGPVLAGSGSGVVSKWDDDVIFRNQAAKVAPRDAKSSEFINDSVHSNAHRKFLEKFVR